MPNEQRGARGPFFAVLLLSLGIYCLSPLELPVGDAIPSTLLARSIVLERDLDLNEYRALVNLRPDLRNRVTFIGSIQEIDGVLYSAYPVGAALLAAPVYAPFVIAGYGRSWEGLAVLGKLSASLMVGLSAAVLFLTIRRVAGTRAAWLLAFGYAIGTLSWPLASQALWQHGPGMLCLSIALYLGVRMQEEARPVDALLLGATLGMSVLCRITNLIPALLLTAFILVRHRRRFVTFALPAIPMACWLIWYNLSTFGELTGGHLFIRTYMPEGQTKQSALDLFTTPLWVGLPGLLVSPSKGLFFHSPYLLFALPALVPAWRDGRFPLGRYLIGWIAMTLVLIGMNGLWWGGGSWGPRYLAEVLAPFSLLIAHGWTRVESRPGRLAVFSAAVALSVAVQTIGAFAYPCNWEPPLVREHPERLWDFADSEILRCLGEALSSRQIE